MTSLIKTEQFCLAVLLAVVSHALPVPLQIQVSVLSLLTFLGWSRGVFWAGWVAASQNIDSVREGHLVNRLIHGSVGVSEPISVGYIYDH